MKEFKNPRRVIVKGADGRIIHDFRVGMLLGSLQVDCSGTRIIIEKKGLFGAKSFIVPDDASVETKNGFWS